MRRQRQCPRTLRNTPVVSSQPRMTDTGIWILRMRHLFFGSPIWSFWFRGGHDDLIRDCQESHPRLCLKGKFIVKVDVDHPTHTQIRNEDLQGGSWLNFANYELDRWSIHGAMERPQDFGLRVIRRNVDSSPYVPEVKLFAVDDFVRSYCTVKFASQSPMGEDHTRN